MRDNRAFISRAECARHSHVAPISRTTKRGRLGTTRQTDPLPIFPCKSNHGECLTTLALFSTVNVLASEPLSKSKVAAGLAVLTLAALAIHGYHPYAEDAEIYLPGVEKILHPGLFPSGTEFFESHASLTLFPHLIAASVRISHLPFDYALFAWHLASIFLLLLGVWEITGNCFSSLRARWGAVALMASLLTLPVAGTALYVMDQYLNPRNLAAFAALFAVARTLERRYLWAGIWIAFGAACHPLMAAFAFSLCALLFIFQRYDVKLAAFALLFPLANFFAPSTPAYHQAARFHGFHYITNWQWFEWLGIVGPVPIFWWIKRISQRRGLHNVVLLCRVLIIYDLAYFAAALIVSVPKQFEALARIQPLRSLHLLYLMLIILSGAFIAEYLLKDRVWRWIALFLPLCTGMFLAQYALFPGSAHIEWPWFAPKNSWEQAFLWIRDTTPVNAVFAIDPMYIKIPGEDTVGFRALAERSRLADAYKDSGAVSMFPPLAEEWWDQFQAQKGWKNFTGQDFQRIQQKYGVKWVVLQAPHTRGLNCPYSNSAVLVCRIEP
jgi:hypothetical protein